MLLLQAADKPVRGLAFAPDGRTLAASDGGGRVRLWDLAARRVTFDFAGAGAVSLTHPMAFSEDGAALVVQRDGPGVRRCLLRRRLVINHDVPVSWGGLTPDGRSVVSVHTGVELHDIVPIPPGNDPTFLPPYGPRWRFETAEFPSHFRTPYCITFAARELVILTGDWRVISLDLGTGRRSRPDWPDEGVHVAICDALATDTAARWLVRADARGFIGAFDVHTRGRTLLARDETPGSKHFAFTPDGEQLYMTTGVGRVRRWETRDWSELPALELCDAPLHALSVAPGGLLAAAGDALGRVFVWDVDGD